MNDFCVCVCVKLHVVTDIFSLHARTCSSEIMASE